MKKKNYLPKDTLGYILNIDGIEYGTYTKLTDNVKNDVNRLGQSIIKTYEYYKNKL